MVPFDSSRVTKRGLWVFLFLIITSLWYDDNDDDDDPSQVYDKVIIIDRVHGRFMLEE